MSVKKIIAGTVGLNMVSLNKSDMRGLESLLCRSRELRYITPRIQTLVIVISHHCLCETALHSGDGPGQAWVY